MIFCSFGELKLLKFGFPAEEGEEVFWIDKEIEDCFGFGKENVLEVCPKGAFELGVGYVLNGRANRPNQ